AMNVYTLSRRAPSTTRPPVRLLAKADPAIRKAQHYSPNTDQPPKPNRLVPLSTVKRHHALHIASNHVNLQVDPVPFTQTTQLSYQKLVRNQVNGYEATLVVVCNSVDGQTDAVYRYRTLDGHVTCQGRRHHNAQFSRFANRCKARHGAHAVHMTGDHVAVKR